METHVTKGLFSVSALLCYWKKYHPERRFYKKLVRPNKEQKLPDILTKQEIQKLIDSYIF